MPFGKHKGCPITDLPDAYLEWATINLEDVDRRLRAALCEECRRRSRYSAPGYSSARPRAATMRAIIRREYLLEVVSAGRRAMASKHHPDTGGDLVKMQDYNEAADILERLVNEACAE